MAKWADGILEDAPGHLRLADLKSGRLIARQRNTGMTFDEIANNYGVEAAINAGIAADPDTLELDDEWFNGHGLRSRSLPNSWRTPGGPAASSARRPRSA